MDCCLVLNGQAYVHVVAQTQFGQSSDGRSMAVLGRTGLRYREGER